MAVGLGYAVGGGCILSESVSEDERTEERRGSGRVRDSLALCSRGGVCFHGCGFVSDGEIDEVMAS